MPQILSRNHLGTRQSSWAGSLERSRSYNNSRTLLRSGSQNATWSSTTAHKRIVTKDPSAATHMLSYQSRVQHKDNPARQSPNSRLPDKLKKHEKTSADLGNTPISPSLQDSTNQRKPVTSRQSRSIFQSHQMRKLPSSHGSWGQFVEVESINTRIDRTSKRHQQMKWQQNFV